MSRKRQTDSRVAWVCWLSQCCHFSDFLANSSDLLCPLATKETFLIWRSPFHHLPSWFIEQRVLPRAHPPFQSTHGRSSSQQHPAAVAPHENYPQIRGGLSHVTWRVASWKNALNLSSIYRRDSWRQIKARTTRSNRKSKNQRGTFALRSKELWCNSACCIASVILYCSCPLCASNFNQCSQLWKEIQNTR